MTDLAEMRERHQRILGELAELGLAFARDARADAEAAETPEQRAQQALVFQRVSRSVRQSLALEARLARDSELATRDAADREAKHDRQRVAARRRQIEGAVYGLAWREFEAAEDEEEFYGAFLDLIEDETTRPDLLTADLADQVARVLGGLGLQIGPDGQIRPAPRPQGEVAQRAGEAFHSETHHPP